MSTISVVLKAATSTAAADIEAAIAKIKAEFGDAVAVAVQFEDAAQTELTVIRTAIEKAATSVESVASGMTGEVTTIIATIKSDILGAITDLKNDLSSSALGKAVAYVEAPVKTVVTDVIDVVEVPIKGIEALIAKLDPVAKAAAVASVAAAITPVVAVAAPAAPIVPAVPKTSIFKSIFSGLFSLIASIFKHAYSGLGTLVSAPFKLLKLIPTPGITLYVGLALTLGVVASVYAGYRFVEDTQTAAINSAVKDAQDKATVQMQALSAQVLTQQANAQAAAQASLLAAEEAAAAKNAADVQAIQSKLDAVVTPPTPPVKPVDLAAPVKKKVKKHVPVDGLSDGDSGVDRLLESASNPN